ncbi:MAG: LptF/LptG family permease [Bacteroidales bacterium]|jgi:lipopolysaccharide export system permease protein|nr:LptF/LptG family permease [Bacteroidales bacterium]MDI9593341.1 LptF/LptG family permease [Bacteroidota bacterium]MBP7873579.1 LptF/LptG family permease [Bacteroidales bacterium]MCO6468375.1 LptF/LptG family permease [Bacteroidales bacterium]MCZ2282602.1 LptF/LptG family permease [Bacteroidales bacterium]
MKIIDRYIIRKFLGTFLYSIALLSVVIIIFDLSEKIDDFLEKEAPLRIIIFDYYLNFIPFFVNMFSYLFTFISVIFFTSKMASNTEIVAILSSGISFKRFLWPYIFSATIIGLLSLFLANFVIPNTNKTLWEFEKKYIKNPIRNEDMNIHMQINPGVFIYVESFNTSTKTGQKFSLEQFDNKGNLVYKLNSDYFSWVPETGKWRIKNYYTRTIDNNKEVFIKGLEIDTTLNLHPSEFTIISDDIKTMDYFELKAFIEKERLRGSPKINEYNVEQYRRYAFPFSTLILTLIGVSLSSRKVRGGIGMHLGIGIGLTFSYILFMQVSQVFAAVGGISPMLAVWIPNIIYGLLSIYMLKIAPK